SGDGAAVAQFHGTVGDVDITGDLHAGGLQGLRARAGDVWRDSGRLPCGAGRDLPCKRKSSGEYGEGAQQPEGLRLPRIWHGVGQQIWFPRVEIPKCVPKPGIRGGFHVKKAALPETW